MKNVEKFLTLNGKTLVDSCRDTGLFPSVFMAQLIQESSGSYGEFGLSQLAYLHHNYGGIKSWSGYTGKTVSMKTGEVFNDRAEVIVARFIKCDSFADFAKWRTAFLKRNARYKNYGVFTAKTPLEQITALKKAGYATDPEYISRVNRHIATYRLTRLDDELKKKIVDLEPVGLTLDLKPRFTWFQKILFGFDKVDSTKVN